MSQAQPEQMQDFVPPTDVETVPSPVPEVPQEPEYISETLYIQNLNEKIKIPGVQRPGSHSSHTLTEISIVMKASLRGLFKTYGEVLDVVAHGNLRMRGQAFVSFESSDIAQKAAKEVRGFPLYSKPMVCGLSNTWIADLIRRT